MPHAALWVVQRFSSQECQGGRTVSMPHAALWVVQRFTECMVFVDGNCFNAARGFVGGATRISDKQVVRR